MQRNLDNKKSVREMTSKPLVALPCEPSLSTEPVQDSCLNETTLNNILEAERFKKKHLHRIEEAIDVVFQVEIDWTVFAPIAKTRGHIDTVGDVVLGMYLNAVATSIETMCLAEEANRKKQAFTDRCFKKIISFRIIADDEMPNDVYAKTCFEDGVLVVQLSRKTFAVKVFQTGEDIESHL